ncbi:shikimate dehydrogenase [Pollutimonas harenae]|uniref:Shikimate dehydrogenase (NADP(+)) n=1 Tax=Pollutimonas harenae TaxID=657015 RepID=A0A853GVD4_9BURK|nr:shikimate dehydrogenase [Pollutimonas harenae]NYT84092.1 shikimate dehydrogenase [Pollutimonas harenae]TEA73484.1 shikimate dehydrogenase [Pollutimonas harenae]
MTTTTSLMRFGVVGNPIAHSRSPFIHEAFASQTGISLCYDRILAPLDGFAHTCKDFFAHGGTGLNITVPFKEQAFVLAQAHLTPRARLAGAVNTLWMANGHLHGCNTDGEGLLKDLERLDYSPAGKRVLLLGAGGAARGAVFPLLAAGCTRLHIANRNPERAQQLQAHILGHMPEFTGRLSAGALQQASGVWDIIINATSSSLGSTPPDLPGGLYASGALAYDMVYASQDTPFMLQAREQGAAQVADGLGMLVGQAAASYEIWHGTRPEISAVLKALRLALYT